MNDWERLYASLLSVLNLSLVSHLVSGIKGFSKSQDKSSTSTLSINFAQRFEEEKLRTLTGKWFKNYLFIFKKCRCVTEEIKHETTKKYYACSGLFEIHSKPLQEFSFILSAFRDSFKTCEKCFNKQQHKREKLPNDKFGDSTTVW